MKERSMNRILKEFPWLWAIKDSWYAPFTEIKIQNTVPPICHLSVKHWKNQFSDYKVVTKSSQCGMHKVAHIDPSRHRDDRYVGGAIMSQADIGDIECIAVYTIDQDERVTLKIFRPPTGKNFRPLLPPNSISLR